MLGKYVLIDSVYVNPVASDIMTNRIRYIKLCLREENRKAWQISSVGKI